MLFPLVSCGSGGVEAEQPVPAVGDSPDSGVEFGDLLRAWSQGTLAQRRALDPKLLSFEHKYPDDDLGKMARVLRAWNALDRNELEQARDLASEAALGAPGGVHDRGSVLRGAVDRRRGHYRQALDRLTPLMHKLIDPAATALLDEEVVRAALGAHQWRRAIDTMAVWLRETEGSARAAAEARIDELLGALAAPELLGALEELGRAEASSPDEQMARLVAARLADLARASRDAKLARVLVDRFGRLLGNRGEQVARLAGSTSRARVTSRTVGLLLSLSSSELRRRTAEVAMGMAFGLGIPGSGARLVSREARPSSEELAAALGELSTEGAAVIVAGLEPTTAGLAADYARASSLPVILLSPPADARAADSPFVFVLGEDPEHTAAVLAAALQAADAKVIVGLGGIEAPAAAPPVSDAGAGPGGGADAGAAAGSASAAALASPSRLTWRELGCGAALDLGPLRAARADGLLVRDGAGCGPEVLDAARSLHARLGVGLGVPGLGASLPADAQLLAAGLFPLDASKPPAALRAWLATGRSVPGWWAALGRDAAVLGLDAVRALPEIATEDAAEVAARRAEAARRLGVAVESLWTTDAKSFGADRRMPRTVVARAAAGGGDAAR